VNKRERAREKEQERKSKRERAREKEQERKSKRERAREKNRWRFNVVNSLFHYGR
jgi:hypothetical protein